MVKKSDIFLDIYRLPGKKFDVSFNLDDAKGTAIEKKIVIIGVEQSIIACKFLTTEAYDRYDKAIGFYLM